MVSSRHVKIVFIGAFPSYESHYTLNWKRSSVYEISVKKIFIVYARIAIYFENVEDIVILSVDIATNVELLFIFDSVID